MERPTEPTTERVHAVVFDLGGVLVSLDGILISADAGVAKPDRRIFDAFVRRFDVRPSLRDEGVFVTGRPRLGDKLRAVPVEERSGRADRCTQHAGTVSVASCDGCGRALCLACAIPVRGLVLGSECLAQVLGEEAPPDEPTTTKRVGTTTFAFVVASLATLPPWTTLGRGSGPFGAWSTSPRWSLLAAVAAIVGLVIAAAGRRFALEGRVSAVAFAILGLAVVVGSVLAWFRPPFPADSVLTPWAAAAAGAVAAISAALELRPRAAQTRSRT